MFQKREGGECQKSNSKSGCFVMYNFSLSKDNTCSLNPQARFMLNL